MYQCRDSVRFRHPLYWRRVPRDPVRGCGDVYKRQGETEMATMEGEEELAYLSEGEDIRFYLGYGTRYLNLNWDDSIPENTIRYRIQYNKKKVKPKFWQHDAAVGFDYPDSDEDRDEMKEVMELRDMILKDLKKGEIGSYQSSPWIESLDLYLNPKNQDDIEIMEIW